MEQTMVFSDDSSQDNTPDSIIAEKSPAHYQYKGILKGKTIQEAHELAVKVSAYVCTQNGAMPQIPEEYTL